MHTPTPNEHHRQLARFAGTWHGIERMHPSPWDAKGGEAKATTTWRVDLGGFVVIADYQQHKNGQAVYAGHGVYTVDPESHDVVLHWFDVMGGQHEQFRGRWNGDVLTVASRNPMGHMRLTYDLSTPGKLENSGEMSADGEQWMRLFDGAHQRQD